MQRQIATSPDVEIDPATVTILKCMTDSLYKACDKAVKELPDAFENAWQLH